MLHWILLESVVVIFAVRSIDSLTAFGKAGAYTMAVPCILGLDLSAGRLLVRATEVCPDIARAIAYLVVVALATVIKLVLRLHKRFAPAAVKSAKRPLENKWVIAWFVVTGVEIVVLEVLVETGVELKGGSPWPACGAPWKEFYFPRFKGLIFWEYVSLVSFVWLGPRRLAPAAVRRELCVDARSIEFNNELARYQSESQFLKYLERPSGCRPGRCGRCRCGRGRGEAPSRCAAI